MFMRSFVNFEVSYKLLPILKFKTLRYPENITVEETYAEVELQSLLDNTALSILQLQEEWAEKSCSVIILSLLYHLHHLEKFYFNVIFKIFYLGWVGLCL